ncbi:hypothetical protein GGI07_000244 [Coemansia sp. Benny D115]|nr:hypothetical protein GGI07_000244 [Coemansia sp. Benny D115]
MSMGLLRTVRLVARLLYANGRQSCRHRIFTQTPAAIQAASRYSWQRFYTTTTPDETPNIAKEKPSDPVDSTTHQKPRIKNKSAPIVKVELIDDEIEEKHVRGWGNGGQKLNKTSSCVQLLHKPTGTIVICQDTRYLQQNRKIARKRLKEKLDLLFNGRASKIGQKTAKLQARKHKQRQRAKKKYHKQDTDLGTTESVAKDDKLD